MSRSVYRLRLGVVCLGLACLAFLQDPGRTAADTKLDLTLDPWGFLSRSLHMWDGHAFFGQLQNQAYGYLFPVGPFFGVLHWLGVTPWVAQRLWWSVVLVTAMLGCVRLLRLLGIRDAPSRVLAGLGFALSARMVTELGPVSVEAWPMALAPWLLVPLVIGAQGGSPRRWASVSALVVLLAGGINAVATAAILPLGALYLLTRSPGPRRRRLMAWWSLGVLLASLWWAIPLLLLGRYSPPFLDWIEGSAVTTIGTDPASVLRGTSQWVAYVSGLGGPAWGAGWALVTTPAIILAGFLLVALAVVGLCRADLPERTFLMISLLAGLALVGMGHVAAEPWTGLGAESVQRALDGALAPLRNVHKFQPLVSLPLAVAVGHALSRLEGWLLARRRGRIAPLWIAVGLVGALVALAALPAMTGQITRGRSYVAVPEYWSQAARWVNAQSSHGRALVVPASSFGVYLWGRSQDEPLQALNTQSWAVRDAVPLSSAGNIRLLDEVERRLGSGTGSAGLTRSLERAGVRWLVVRNDLDRSRTGAASPAVVHQALATSPGIRKVAAFGPTLLPTVAESRAVDGGASLAVPAVEIFEVAESLPSGDDRVVVRDASTVTRFSGGPEALVDLAEHQLVGAEPAVAADDPLPSGLAGRSVLTDTYRRVEANFGSSSNQYSETMTEDQPWRSIRRVHDYELDSGPATVTAEFTGMRASASSSGSSPFALRARGPGAQPWAAVDGDPVSAWMSGDLTGGVGQWWQVDLDQPEEVGTLQVRLVTDRRVGPAPSRIQVSTDSGDLEVPVSATPDWQSVSLGVAAPTTRLRLTLAAVKGGGAGSGFGIAEVRIPGVTAGRTIPMGSSDGSGGVLVSARSSDREACVPVDSAFVCHPDLALPGEERAGLARRFEITQPGEYRVQARYRSRPGSGLDSRLALPERGVTVSASSQLVSDPAGRAQAALDGEPRTTWIADPVDREPMLRLTWPEPVEVRGLELSTSPVAAASSPLMVQVLVGGRTLGLVVDAEGSVAFPEVTTDELLVRFTGVQRRFAPDPLTGRPVPLPVGITEIGIDGSLARTAALGPSVPVAVACGFAPSVVIDGTTSVPMGLSTTAGDLVEGQVVPSDRCGQPISLSAGVHELVVEPTAELLVDSVALVPVDRPSVAPRTSASVTRWDPTERSVELAAAPSVRVLETTENFNDGWAATLGGTVLQPLQVDGWRQAFVVPAGLGGTVDLTYRPDATYRAGLAIGAVAASVLLGLGLARGPGRWPALVPVERPGLVLALTLGVVLWLAGWLSLAIAAGLVLAVAAVSRRHPRSAARLASLAAVSAALALAVSQPLLAWPARLQHAGLHAGLVAVLPSAMLVAVALRGWLLRHSGPPDRRSAPLVSCEDVPTMRSSDVPAGAS